MKNKEYSCVKIRVDKEVNEVHHGAGLQAHLKKIQKHTLGDWGFGGDHNNTMHEHGETNKIRKQRDLINRQTG